jgi:hypothetical protein
VEVAVRYGAGATGSPDDDYLQLVYLVERDGFFFVIGSPV